MKASAFAFAGAVMTYFGFMHGPAVGIGTARPRRHARRRARLSDRRGVPARPLPRCRNSLPAASPKADAGGINPPAASPRRLPLRRPPMRRRDFCGSCGSGKFSAQRLRVTQSGALSGRNRRRNRRRPSGGNDDARTDARAQLSPASARSTTRRLHQPARGSRRASPRRARLPASASAEPPALRRARRGQGQYRRRAACRRRPPARPLPISRRMTRPRSHACARPAPSSSARPISTSSPPGLSACARLTAPRAIRSTPSSFPADRAPAPASRSPPVSCRWRSAPTPPAPAACRQASTTSSASSRASASSRPSAWCRPAARSIASRCLALTVDDAWTALAAIAGRDENDAYSRDRPLGRVGAMPRASQDRRAAPGQRLFFGDTDYAVGLRRGAGAAGTSSAPRSSRSTSSRSTRPRGCSTTGPGSPSARSRRARCLASDPNAIHPVTREIILGGLRPTRDRRLRRLLQAGRIALDRAATPSRKSTAGAADGADHLLRSSKCWPTRSSSTAGSAPTPISSICSISAGWRCRPR